MRPGGQSAREFGAGGYNAATRLYDEGLYAEALPILRCVAKQGQGYEIAQHLAGMAALNLSGDEALSADRRADYRSEGFDRLTLAAGAGWPGSQAELARKYFEIDTPEARAEAAYWAEVYARNPRDRAIGLDRIGGETGRAIDAAVGPDGLSEAQARSAAFLTEPLEAEEIDGECRTLLAPAAPQRRGLPGIEFQPRSGPRGGGRGRSLDAD
jgi:hypothetical protein